METTSHWHPFAPLNLTANPFGELTPDDRAAAAVVNVEPWREWLASGPRRALQFIGDCGRGKTTHLLALAAAMPDSAYVYLPPHPLEQRKLFPPYWLPSQAPLPEIPHATVVAIDEAQRLPRRLRRQVFLRGVPLVLGTHCNLARPLRQAGYEWQNIAVAASTTVKQIQAIVNRRIELVRLAEGKVPCISMQQATELHELFGDDLRAIEGHLYEQFQQRAAARTVRNAEL